MKKDLFKVRLFSLAGLFGFMLTLASCANEEVVQKATNTDNDKNLTSFMAGAPESRTSMDYNSGAFYWEAGDYIYVKDDNNVWQKSSNAPTAKTAKFKFYVPGDFKNSNTYEVYYPGKNGNKDKVTISTTQTQTEPNSTIHFGESGDCGTANAVKNISATGHIDFRFSIDHQSAYLVFQPYTSNTILQKCYLTKVEVTSDDNIAATYTLDPVNGLTGTGTGKQITLTTKGSGTYTNGFPLNTHSANVTTNGAYMVIKPGTHTLKVRYWVKDIVTNVEGAITKTLTSFNYEKNNYYDMTAELNVHDYDGDHYYTWDAKKQYWDGWEWTKKLSDGQPTLNGNSSPHYPGSTGGASDPRDNFMGAMAWTVPTNSCTITPNKIEMLWYVAKGDPRWDADKLWTTMGHLYKGGIWFKKKTNITNFSKIKDYQGQDASSFRVFRTYTWSISDTPPSSSEESQYFYLPALGSYTTGQLDGVGINGYYWSSTIESTDTMPWCLFFDKNGIKLSGKFYADGCRVQAFE